MITTGNPYEKIIKIKQPMDAMILWTTVEELWQKFLVSCNENGTHPFRKGV